MGELARLHLEQVVGEREQAENFSVSSFLSASPIRMPRVSASIFITAAPISVNGTY
jgi:hypothetical protein